MDGWLDEWMDGWMDGWMDEMINITVLLNPPLASIQQILTKKITRNRLH